LGQKGRSLFDNQNPTFIRRLSMDMEGRSGDAMPHRSFHRAIENVILVVVHAEHEGAVDHDAKIAEPGGHRCIASREIPLLVTAEHIGPAE
jgi:hypothetical protein